jgi:Cft2 family RNA processing exonuclease
MIRRQYNEPQLSCYTLGVGQNTEGVSLLLRLGYYRILFDCGLTNLDSLLSTNQPPVDFVFCSHAHSDHARGLLALHQKFPEIPIYTSEVTAKLLPLNWLDFGTIPSFCQVLPWRSPQNLTENLAVELFPSGHLPGAAAILLYYKTLGRVYKIFYTGDFCLSNLQLVDGLALDSVRGLNPDILIIEATYGTARHPHRRQQEKQLMTRIRDALTRKQNVLLPVPTLGLAQEILKLLRSHHEFTGKNIDIWVDGKIGIACDLYLELIGELPQTVQNFAQNQALFWDEKITPRVHRVTQQINRSQLPILPAIVLTDNLTHLREYCSQNNGSWLILTPEHSKIRQNPQFIEFCSDFSSNTPSPDNDISVTEFIYPELSFDTYLLADHSDGRNTTQLIHNLRPQHIIFIHGSVNYLTDLTSLEELQSRYQLHSPSVDTLVELPIGEKFIQPTISSQNTYEGELNETGAYITITLPEQINRDPRWQSFADTGLISARWQGEELVLRGISQRELLQQNSSFRRQLHFDCCSNCLYYQNQYCTNPQSPLYEFQVTPKGYCPVFEIKL